MLNLRNTVELEAVEDDFTKGAVEPFDVAVLTALGQATLRLSSNVEPFELTDLLTAVLALPLVEGRLAYAMLTANVGYTLTSLVLCQNRNDLALCKILTSSRFSKLVLLTVANFRGGFTWSGGYLKSAYFSP